MLRFQCLAYCRGVDGTGLLSTRRNRATLVSVLYRYVVGDVIELHWTQHIRACTASGLSDETSTTMGGM